MLITLQKCNSSFLNFEQKQFLWEVVFLIFLFRSPMTSGANIVGPGSAPPNSVVAGGQMGPRGMRHGAPPQMFSSHVDMQPVCEVF